MMGLVICLVFSWFQIYGVTKYPSKIGKGFIAVQAMLTAAAIVNVWNQW